MSRDCAEILLRAGSPLLTTLAPLLTFRTGRWHGLIHVITQVDDSNSAAITATTVRKMRGAVVGKKFDWPILATDWTGCRLKRAHTPKFSCSRQHAKVMAKAVSAAKCREGKAFLGKLFKRAHWLVRDQRAAFQVSRSAKRRAAKSVRGH